MELLLLFGWTLLLGGLVLGVLAHWDRSRLDKEGTVLLFWFPLAGALSVLPSFGLYALAETVLPARGPGQWAQILFIWTVNAPIEEISKYLSFVVLTVLLRSLREPQDGILQGAATGLGFGLIENLLYGLSGGWDLLVLRSLVSLPGHLIYGAVWGGYHGFEFYQGRGKVHRKWIPLLALVPAAFAHALFNTLITIQAPLEAALAGDTLALGFGLFLFLRLRSVSPSRLNRPLREWKIAIPEMEHALALNSRSSVLRRRLAAYQLVGGQPQKALATLAPLDDEPWTRFYRQAARRRLDADQGPLPVEADLDPRLFRTLSGG